MAERHNEEEVKAVIDCCEDYGINILDCWMSEPNVRTNIGKALKGNGRNGSSRTFGSTWQDGQYVRTREMDKVKEAFSDLLTRLQTDYIDLGMIHFVDEEAEFHRIMEGEFLAYVKEQKEQRDHPSHWHEHPIIPEWQAGGLERRNRNAPVQY